MEIPNILGCIVQVLLGPTKLQLEIQAVLNNYYLSRYYLGREEKDLVMKAGMLPENHGSRSLKFFGVMQITKANSLHHSVM